MAKRIVRNNKEVKGMDMEVGNDFELDLDLDELEGLDDMELDLDELELDGDDMELDLDDDMEIELDEEDDDIEDLEMEAAMDDDEDDDMELDLDDDMEIELDDEDDDIELDLDDEEEIEEVKPAKKSMNQKKEAPKKETKKATPKKETKKETAKKETKKAAPKKETKTTKSAKPQSARNIAASKRQLTYAEQLDEIKEKKVDMYYQGLQDYRDGKIKICAINRKVSRQAFSQLWRAKVNEEDSALRKAVASMTGLKPDDIAAGAITNLPKNHARFVVDELFDVIYDLLTIESGLEIFNTEDCKLSIEGNWTEEQVKVNKLSHTTHNATKLNSYLKVSSSSQAPENKKVKGNVDAKGKFKAVKETKKK